MKKYAKALAALGATVLTLLVPYLSAGHMTKVSWIQFAISFTTAFGVWAAANLPQFKYAKALVAAVLAALNLVVTDLAAGHMVATDWMNVAVAVLAALGVLAVPNKSAPAE